ncbi:MAG: type II toxin-antitoxin system VapC family toxin [Promethearchaeota archaeon]|nr:MAG: type II toxin-antitoxin system VapC family toxin [Candidatus Lokiarchaeota archaeon]
MKNSICLDTGIITQFYSKEPPRDIIVLMNNVKKNDYNCKILYPILVEAYYHMCKFLGKIGAETRIASFIEKYPVNLVNLNKSLIFKAGELKCQYSNSLSYNDCIIIAYALNKKITIHTTEKGLNKLFPTLKLKEYLF